MGSRFVFVLKCPKAKGESTCLVVILHYWREDWLMECIWDAELRVRKAQTRGFFVEWIEDWRSESWKQVLHRLGIESMVAYSQFMACWVAHKIQYSEVGERACRYATCVLKFCQITSKRLAYSGVLVLLVAGEQAKCVIDSELGYVILVHMRLVFLKATSKGFRRINWFWFSCIAIWRVG